MSDASRARGGEIVAHDLRLRIEEAEDTLAAIRTGDVDALVVTSDGEPRVFILKGADHAHRILLETLNEGAITASADGTILYANRRFAEMLGAPLGRVVGVPLGSFVARRDAETCAALLARAASGPVKGEIAMETSTGESLPAMVSIRAVAHPDAGPRAGVDHPAAGLDEPGAYTLVLTDLTPLKEAQRALEQANDELEARVEARTLELSRANDALRAQIAERERLEGELRRNAALLIEADRRKDEFLSMLAHELRNPLAPIVAAVEMIRLKVRGDAALDRYRAIIDRQAKNLARLVDDLLDVSRISRGSVTLRKERVELAAIVKRAVEAARPLVDGGRHQLTVSIPPDPVEVDVDPMRFEQVLVNLLNNAAKYTEPGGHIQLTAELDGGEVVIRVRDDGLGISAELLPRVFDLFVQGERSLDRAQGGLGIGLTLVKSLVAMHGGRVEAHSEGPRRGSEIVVRVPAADPRPQVEPVAEESVAAAPPRVSRKVLGVEDSADAAFVTTLLPGAWSVQVSGLNNTTGLALVEVYDLP